MSASEGNFSAGRILRKCPGLLAVIYSEGGVREAVFSITSYFSGQFHGAETRRLLLPTHLLRPTSDVSKEKSFVSSGGFSVSFKNK